MPSTQWLTHSRAWEREKWERSDRNASGLVHIFRKALLQTPQVRLRPHAPPAIMACTYFRRSPGTRCTTLTKLLTASARPAFLEKSR